MYKLFLCIRYLRKRRIAFFAVAAVCLCVMMVLIVVSVMTGFLQMVKDRSRGMLGDLIVENTSLQGFSHYEELISDLKAQMADQIEEATPVLISYGVIRFPETKITKPVQIVGIRLDETSRVNEFKEGLFYEHYYPGTTHLGDQQIPGYGLDPRRLALARQLEAQGNPDFVSDAFHAAGPGRVVLPDPLQAAWDRWWAAASEAERQKAPRKDSAYGWAGIYRSVPPREGMSIDELAPAWFDKPLPGVILGTDLCAERKQDGTYDRFYYRGEMVQITFVPFTWSGKPVSATGMPSRVFRYVDDSRTGVYDIDSMSVYIDYDIAQQLLNMHEQTLDEDEGGGRLPPRTTQVQIKLRKGVNPYAARGQVEQIWNRIKLKYIGSDIAPALLDRVRVQTWEQKQAKFIAAVEKERMLVTILFAIISLVSAILVGCILYMIVNQKTRDIGIVKSVGATSLGIAQIFIAFGAAIGVVGGLFGCVLGTVFVWCINDIQDQLTKLNPSLQVWNAEVYAFDRIPNHVDPLTVIVIFFAAIGLAMLGSIIAAWRAARVWPVEALRYE
jgi:lipoprotein-releasing system permease protein